MSRKQWSISAAVEIFIAAPVVLFAFLFTFLSTALAGDDEGRTSYGVVVMHDVMVPMRDGVQLAADLYMPASNGAPLPGPWPAVLERTPYGKSFFFGNTPSGADYAQRGYVFVVQDVRGRGHSDGVFDAYAQEGPDGFDTMQWVHQQAWSNKKIGVTGSSYFASTAQAILVQNNAPGLVAAIIREGSGNYHEDGAWHGGAFLLAHNIEYAVSSAFQGKEATADPNIASLFLADLAPAAAFQLMKQSPLPASAPPFVFAASYNAWYQKWQGHELYDSYWKINGNSFTDYYRRSADVPILLVSQWYDAFLGGMLDAYAGYSTAHHSPVKLLVGGGEHLNIYAPTQTFAGDVDFGPDLPIDIPSQMFSFWARHLQGHRGQSVDDTSVQVSRLEGLNGQKDDTSVQVFRLEGLNGQKNAAGHLQATGSWETLPNWPPSDARPTSFYLTRSLQLASTPPAGGALSFTYDPTNPVPSVGGNVSSGGGIVQPGPYDQRCSAVHLACGTSTQPLSERPDVLSFATGPLATDVDVTGMVSADLWVSSSAVDTDFTAKLIDQYPPTADYPNGYAMILTDSVVRARLRSFTRAGANFRRLYAIANEPLTPGAIYQVTIDLSSTSNLFKAGHKIRLDISSSNFPLRDANPNTGEPFAARHSPLLAPVSTAAAVNTVYAVNTVHVGARYPSALVLPIRPGRRHGGEHEHEHEGE